MPLHLRVTPFLFSLSFPLKPKLKKNNAYYVSRATLKHFFHLQRQKRQIFKKDLLLRSKQQIYRGWMNLDKKMHRTTLHYYYQNLSHKLGASSPLKGTVAPSLPLSPLRFCHHLLWISGAMTVIWLTAFYSFATNKTAETARTFSLGHSMSLDCGAMPSRDNPSPPVSVTFIPTGRLHHECTLSPQS